MTSSVMTRMPRLWASVEEGLEIVQGAVGGIHGSVVGDVVPVVP